MALHGKVIVFYHPFPVVSHHLVSFGIISFQMLLFSIILRVVNFETVLALDSPICLNFARASPSP